MDKNFQTCDLLLEIKLIDKNDITSFCVERSLPNNFSYK
jgi:hypothetical protein